MTLRAVGTLIVNPEWRVWVETNEDGRPRFDIVDSRFLEVLTRSVPCRVGGANIYEESIEIEGDCSGSPPAMNRVIRARVVSDGDEFVLHL